MVMRDLKTLWDQDLQSYHLLAVQDMGVIQVSGKYGLRNYQALGIPATAAYFNSGVMVISLQKWCQDNIGAQLIDYINNNADFLELHDQDALNAVLFDKWGQLDPAWNQQYHVFRFRSWRRSPVLGMKRGWRPSPLSKEVYQRVLSQPYIVHFTYYLKPWVMYFYPYRRSFYRYVDRTAWAGWRRPWWQAALHSSRRRFKRVMDFPRRRLNYLLSHSQRLISKVQ
jgi:lipopolysaccharide biosynthesis glycosyltransferase